MDLTIRAAEPRDLTGLTALMNLPGYRHGTLRLPFESEESARKRLFEGGPNMTLLVALLDGELVGTIHLMRWTGRRAHVGGIGMGVHDAHTGRGIGRRLMETILDLADNWLGLTRLELSVNVDNARAIRLYELSGFEIEGRERQSILRDGVLVDAFTMSRLRAPPRPASDQANAAS
ncbi:GNAT family N-acetyltransferase [Aureimonas sp. N4]|nr:GNAT family N-acetyltransferase [Aureimonas sp. N4]